MDALIYLQTKSKSFGEQKISKYREILFYKTCDLFHVDEMSDMLMTLILGAFGSL